MQGSRFRVLGPAGVDPRPGAPAASAGSVLASRNQRVLLTVLLARPGQPVRTQVLMQVLWGERRPRTARQTLRTYISRLRQVVGDRLVASNDGYLLQVSAGEVDSGRFTALVDGARSAPPDQAVVQLTEALGLWRGRAFEDARDAEPVRDLARSLEQARTAARESLGRAMVLAGHPAEAIAVARALVTDEPLNEAAWAVLMDAFSAAGRNADALVAYRQARKALAAEGLEPSAALEEAQARSLHPPRPALAGEP